MERSEWGKSSSKSQYGDRSHFCSSLSLTTTDEIGSAICIAMHLSKGSHADWSYMRSSLVSDILWIVASMAKVLSSGSMVILVLLHCQAAEKIPHSSPVRSILADVTAF
jgi:hypothetical protein